MKRSTLRRNPLQILVVTDRYFPEISAASTRLHDHARMWVRRGHQVTVLTCAPNFPKGQLFPGYSNRWTQIEEIEGVRVMRVWSFMAPNIGVLRRSLDYASFMVSAVLHSGSIGKPDVVLASSPPITVAFASALIARLIGRPWVFEVRDLWPASIRAVGFSRNPFLNLIERLELALYKDAAATIVLTEPFREDLEARKVNMDRVSVVTNGITVDLWKVDRKVRADVRRQLCIPQQAFVVAFIGTVGLAQGSEVFVRTAERMRLYTDVHFLCVGEGADRQKLEQRARDAGVTSITFSDFVPFKEMPRLLSAVDVGTVLLKNDPVFDTVIPSKLLELMAAGVPIAAAAGREVARIIAASGGGLCVAPEDSEALEQSILALRSDAGLRREMALAGRRYVRREFDRVGLADQALAVMEQVR